jgi:signal transduction histidine kinase
LLRPALQLKLPIYVVLVTVGFGLVWALHGYVAFERLLTSAFEHTVASESLKEVFWFQTMDFLLASSLIALVYVLVVLGVCVFYAHRMVGPTVAFRRQLAALKLGDYSQRVRLRNGDAFVEVADDLNELAERLAARESGHPAEQPAAVRSIGGS